MTTEHLTTCSLWSQHRAYTPAAVPISADRRPAEELFTSGPSGIILLRIYDWADDHVLPVGKWQAPDALIDRLPDLPKPVEKADTLRLVSGRELHKHNRIANGRYGQKRFDADVDLALS